MTYATIFKQKIEPFNSATWEQRWMLMDATGQTYGLDGFLSWHEAEREARKQGLTLLPSNDFNEMIEEATK